MLSDEQAGKLLKSLMNYSESGIEPDFTDPMLKMVFSFLASQIRRDADKYAETCKKRSENGKKGGAPKKNRNAAKNNQNNQNNQKQAKQADNDNDSDSDNENENDDVTVCDSDSVTCTHGTAHTPHTSQQMSLHDVLALAVQLGFNWDESEAQEFLAYNIDKGRTTGWGYAVRKWEENRNIRRRQGGKRNFYAPASGREIDEMNDYLSLSNRFKADYEEEGEHESKVQP